MARKEKARPNAGRAKAADKRRLFAHAYLANGGNGRAAAREAGYTGKDHCLDVTASRLLRHADVRAILDAHMKRAETALAERAGMSTEELLERIGGLGRSDISNFIRFITPKETTEVIKACGEGKKGQARAEYILRCLEARGGWYLDVEGAIKAGHGQQVRKLKLTHNDFGLPEVELELHNPNPSHALLAKIKGLTRDKEPAPPAPPALALAALAALSLPHLAALNAALEEAAAKARALPMEATRA